MESRTGDTSSRSAVAQHTRDTEPQEGNDAIWSTLLNNVASSKILPQRNLIVLGGAREDQNNFVESLAQQPLHNKARNRRDGKIPFSNVAAVGYTYQNVLDTDHEGTKNPDETTASVCNY